MFVNHFTNSDNTEIIMSENKEKSIDEWTECFNKLLFNDELLKHFEQQFIRMAKFNYVEAIKQDEVIIEPGYSLNECKPLEAEIAIVEKDTANTDLNRRGDLFIPLHEQHKHIPLYGKSMMIDFSSTYQKYKLLQYDSERRNPCCEIIADDQVKESECMVENQVTIE